MTFAALGRFPLYLKGREKYEFDYGVYLLNKNVAQLRHHCGLTTRDLRTTLANIRSLLQLRLGAKLYEGRAKSLVTQPASRFRRVA